MGKIKKGPAGQRGERVRDRRSAKGSDKQQWVRMNPEDDPFHDLRPEEDDMRNSSNDEFIWPDLHDENEDDD